MRTKALIDSAVEHLRTSASVKTVYGEPVKHNGKTIIPVARVRPAAGEAMGGEAEGVEAPAGSAGGVAAKPIGVVEISGEETRFVSFGQTKRLAWATAIGSAFGLFFGMLLGRRRGA